MASKPLAGRTALVTGGANGIGRSIVAVLADQGASVAVVDVDEAAMAGVVDRARADGGRVEAFPCDLLDPQAIERAVTAAAASLGPVGILVNNAGVMDAMRPVTATTLEHWERIMAINVTAPFLLCRAVVPSMLEQGGGAIVNIASLAGLTGGRAGVAYTSSKHAVVGLTRNVAWTYGDQGIRCNAICPGAVRTAIMTRSDPPDEVGNVRYRLSASTRPRPGEPTEIANVAAFLASDAASFINGATVPVDGGWLAA